MWALKPLRIASLSGYNSRDGGSNVSANRAAETGREGRATTPVKQNVKLARRHECRRRRQKAIEVGYRDAFSRRGFG